MKSMPTKQPQCPKDLRLFLESLSGSEVTETSKRENAVRFTAAINPFRKAAKSALNIKDFIEFYCTTKELFLIYDTLFEYSLFEDSHWDAGKGILVDSTLQPVLRKITRYIENSYDSRDYNELLKLKFIQSLTSDANFSYKSKMLSQALKIPEWLEMSNSIKLINLFEKTDMSNGLQRAAILNRILNSNLTLDQYRLILLNLSSNVNKHDAQINKAFVLKLIEQFGEENVLKILSMKNDWFKHEIFSLVLHRNTLDYIQYLPLESLDVFSSSKVILDIIKNNQNLNFKDVLIFGISQPIKPENNKYYTKLIYQNFIQNNSNTLNEFKDLDILNLPLQLQENFVTHVLNGNFILSKNNSYTAKEDLKFEQIAKDKMFEIIEKLTVNHPMIKDALSKHLFKQDIVPVNIFSNSEMVTAINKYQFDTNLFNNWSISSMFREVSNQTNRNEFKLNEYIKLEANILNRSNLNQIKDIIVGLLPYEINNIKSQNYESIAETQLSFINKAREVFLTADSISKIKFIEQFNKLLLEGSTYKNQATNTFVLSYLTDKAFIQKALKVYIDNFVRVYSSNSDNQQKVLKDSRQNKLLQCYLVANYNNLPKNIVKMKEALIIELKNKIHLADSITNQQSLLLMSGSFNEKEFIDIIEVIGEDLSPIFKIQQNRDITQFISIRPKFDTLTQTECLSDDLEKTM